MNHADSGSSLPASARRVYIYQSSAAVYVQPASDDDPLTRLSEGEALWQLPYSDVPEPGWTPIQTLSGQKGFIKSVTKLTTKDSLLVERASIADGIRMGWIKMVIGGLLILVVGAILVATFMLASERGGPVYLFYGLLALGAGQFFWGVEQMINARRALKVFDSQWREALSLS